jgi:hypothetical protein
MWAEWVAFLRHQGAGSGGTSALLRAALALALVVAGARNGRAWVLGPALLVCTPVLGGVNVLAMLTAVPRLARLDVRPVPPWWLRRPARRGSSVPDLAGPH